MTVSSRSWTRSKVVKRAAQLPQNRRRRIAPRSSVGRESLTWVSSAPQNGQRISFLRLVGPARSRAAALGPAGLGIDREAGAERGHRLTDLRLDRSNAAGVPCQPVQQFADPL